MLMRCLDNYIIGVETYYDHADFKYTAIPNYSKQVGYELISWSCVIPLAIDRMDGKPMLPPISQSLTQDMTAP